MSMTSRTTRSARRISVRPAEASRRPLIVAAAIVGCLLLAVAVIYGRSLGFGFLAYDDPAFVLENSAVRGGLTGQGIVWAFTGGPFGEWYPLAMLSHMLDCELFGLDARWHHLTSVLLHAATAVGLFLVWWRISGGLWTSAFAAMLFAVHPQRVESVVWIAERRDVLSGLFFVLTLGAYLGYVRHGRSWAWYALVALLFTLGLLAKPMLVTVPALLLLLDYWPLGRFGQASGIPAANAAIERPGAVWLVLEKIPLGVLAAADAFLTLRTHAGAGNFVAAWPARFGNAAVAYVKYLGELFYPLDLAAFYPMPTSGPPMWQVAGALAMLAAVSAVVVIGRRRYPDFFVGWLWYLGMLVPVLGLFNAGWTSSMADRYTYLPSIGLYLALAGGLKRLAAGDPRRRLVLAAVAAIAVAAFTALAFRQTSVWRDDVVLWRHALAVTGENPMAEANLGRSLSNLSRLDEAIEHYRRALRRPPINPTTCVDLGIALARQGKLDEATALFNQAIAIDPHYAAPHANLAATLAVEGHPAEAIEEYRKAIELDPASGRAHYKLGKLLAQRGEHEAAIDEYRAHYRTRRSAGGRLRRLCGFAGGMRAN